MKTYVICPISSRKINENIARFNALLTVLLLGSYVLTSNIFIIVFLLIDFLFRAIELSQFSPLAYVSKNVVRVFHLKQKFTNAGPKIFAARIGVFFNSAILFSALLGLNTLTLALTAVFGACAFLEGAFGFCVACQIYPFVYKIFYDSKLITEK